MGGSLYEKHSVLQSRQEEIQKNLKNILIIFNHLPKFIMIMSENTFYCKVAYNINLTYATRVREPNSTPTKLSVMKKRPGSPRFDRRTHSVPEQGLQCPGASWRRCCGLAPGLSQLSQDQLLMKPTAVSCWKLETFLLVVCPYGTFLTDLTEDLTFPTLLCSLIFLLQIKNKSKQRVPTWELSSSTPWPLWWWGLGSHLRTQRQLEAELAEDHPQACKGRGGGRQASEWHKRFRASGKEDRELSSVTRWGNGVPSAGQSEWQVQMPIRGLDCFLRASFKDGWQKTKRTF